MTETHTCPRRIEDGTDTTDSPFTFAGPNRDTYQSGHGLVGQGRGCTYCGSMHPGDFMEALRDGARLGVTDKNYKAYVEGYQGNGPNGGKFYYQHLSVEQRHELIRMLNAREIKFQEIDGMFLDFRHGALPYFIGMQA